MSTLHSLAARIRNAANRRPVRQRDSEDSMAAAVTTLLRRLDVPVSLGSVREQLATHPEFPRLPCAIESLAQWGVPVRAVRADWEHLAELPGPVLAHLDRGREPQLVVLTGVSGESAELIAPDRGARRLARSEFCARWSGILLIPSVQPGAGEPDHARKRRSERLAALRTPLLWSAAALTAAALLAGLPPLPREFAGLWAGLGAIKLLGAALCAVLVGLSSAGAQQRLRRLCPVGGVLSCAAVLESPAAHIGGWLPVADAGALYFTGGLLALALGAASGHAAAAAGLLAALNLAALPYTLFSIGYQAAVVRRWCWLCVATQLLIYAELAALWVHGAPLATVSAALRAPGAAGLLGLAAFALPALAWAGLHPLLARARSAEPARREAERLRNTPALLEAALRRQPQVPAEPAGGVLLGDPAAPLRLTVVSHPQCPACVDMHRELDSLLQSAGGQLHCSLQLVASAQGSSARIAARVAELHCTAGDGAAAEALAAWYSDLSQDPEQWLARFPAPAAADAKQLERLKQEQRRWTAAAGVTATPALFINGRALPAGFGLTALRHFLRQRAQQGGAATRAAA